jgi:hypothetical protein
LPNPRLWATIWDVSALSTGSASARERIDARARSRERGERWSVLRRLGVIGAMLALGMALPLVELPRWRGEGVLFLERQDGARLMSRTPLTALEPFDADADGQLDIVVAVEDSAFGGVERVEAWNRAGEIVASWSADTHTSSIFGESEWIASAGDVDGDGRGEVLLRYPTRVVSIASGAVRELGGPAELLDGVGAGDLDGDGRADLALAFVGGGERLLVRGVRGADGAELWSSDVAQGSRRSQGPSTKARLARMGDLDGDDVAELACVAFTRDLEHRLVVLSGATGAILNSNTTRPWLDVANAGDVDRDGLDDVLAFTDAFAAVYGERGTIELLTLEMPRGVVSRALGIGDLDGDGRAELLLVADEAGGSPSLGRIHRGADGSVLRELRWSRHSHFPAGGVAPAGDLDGDGVNDLLVCAPREHDNEWLPNAWRRPRSSWAMVYSGRFLAASSEPLEIR